MVGYPTLVYPTNVVQRLHYNTLMQLLATTATGNYMLLPFHIPSLTSCYNYTYMQQHTDRDSSYMQLHMFSLLLQWMLHKPLHGHSSCMSFVVVDNATQYLT